MDTVAHTQNQTEENQRKELPCRKRKLKQHFLKQAQRMLRSRTDYTTESDPFDYLREDTAMMQGFFNWLNYASLRLERMQEACMFYCIHGDGSEKEKTLLAKDLRELLAFNNTLVAYQGMIALKAYYYEDILKELDEVKAYRDTRAG